MSPLTRNIVFSHISASPAARAALDPPITWGGWSVPGPLSALLVGGIGLVLLVVAMLQFARVE